MDALREKIETKLSAYPVCEYAFVKPKALPEIEVLVVNDGSSDRTVEIAEKYAEYEKDSI